MARVLLSLRSWPFRTFPPAARASGAAMSTGHGRIGMSAMVVRLIAIGTSAAGLCLAAAAPVSAADAAPAEVVIYRCTDAQGRLSLRSSPCPAGETQAVKRMARPQDAATRPAARPSAAPAPAAATPTADIAAPPYRPAPRSVYVCQGADGRRYLSDSATGSPRVVSQWVAIGAAPPLPPPAPPGPPPPPSPRSDGLRPGRVDAQTPQARPRAAPVSARGGARFAGMYGGAGGGADGGVSIGISGGYGEYGGYDRGHHDHAGGRLLVHGGTGIAYDRCERLPAAEACPRLRAERDALGRALFNAPPGGREALEAERAALADWWAQDCR